MPVANGGEEFVLLLPETGSEGAGTVAEKVRAAIASTPMELSGTTPLPVRVSIGVATRSAAMIEADELYSAARPWTERPLRRPSC